MSAHNTRCFENRYLVPPPYQFIGAAQSANAATCDNHLLPGAAADGLIKSRAQARCSQAPQELSPIRHPAPRSAEFRQSVSQQNQGTGIPGKLRNRRGPVGFANVSAFSNSVMRRKVAIPGMPSYL